MPPPGMIRPPSSNQRGSNSSQFRPSDVPHPMRIALNVYTLPYVGAKSLGVYHSGLEIEQFLEPHPYFDQVVEYSFREIKDAKGRTGVFKARPKDPENGYNFKETIQMGVAYISPEQLEAILVRLEGQFMAEDYHLTKKNCNHFTDLLASILLGQNIPPKVNRLAEGISSPFGRGSRGESTDARGELSVHFGEASEATAATTPNEVSPTGAQQVTACCPAEALWTKPLKGVTSQTPNVKVIFVGDSAACKDELLLFLGTTSITRSAWVPYSWEPLTKVKIGQAKFHSDYFVWPSSFSGSGTFTVQLCCAESEVDVQQIRSFHREAVELFVLCYSDSNALSLRSIETHWNARMRDWAVDEQPWTLLLAVQKCNERLCVVEPEVAQKTAVMVGACAKTELNIQGDMEGAEVAHLVELIAELSTAKLRKKGRPVSGPVLASPRSGSQSLQDSKVEGQADTTVTEAHRSKSKDSNDKGCQACAIV